MVTLTLTSTGNGNCIAEDSSITITITPAPKVEAGPDQVVCANNRDVTLAGSFQVTTGATWTTNGSGGFNPNNTTMNAVYTPSDADTAARNLVFVLTADFEVGKSKGILAKLSKIDV